MDPDQGTQHNHAVSIKIDGDDIQKFTLPQDGTLLVRMVDGKPTIIEYDSNSWNALSDAITSNLDDFLTSGNDAQKSAYSLFQQTLPVERRQGAASTTS